MKRKNVLRLTGTAITLVTTCLGGSLMVERGSTRPGVLMITAGLITAVVMIRIEPRDSREKRE